MQGKDVSTNRSAQGGRGGDGPRLRSRGWSDEMRRRIIEAGLAELQERGLRPGVGHIRLTEVTERAEVSLAIAYRIWGGSRTRDGLGGQDRFHRDLVAEAFRTLLTDYPAAFGGEAAQLLTVDAPIEELIRVTAATLYETLSGDGTNVGIVLGLYGATLNDPELSAVATTAHEQAIDDFTGIVGWILDRYGREMADGLSVRDLVVAVTALAAGFLVRHRVEPGIALRPVPGPGSPPPRSEWTLFGLCIWALVDRFTRPAARPAEPVTRAARPRSAVPPL